jgi:hypothetical protein
MCNFLRRPGDYEGTEAHGYLTNVIVDSSIPNVTVSYASKPHSSSHSLVALRTFIAHHPEEMANLASSNPDIFALLVSIVDDN